MIVPLMAMLLNIGCTGNQSTTEDTNYLSTDANTITHETMQQYNFLEGMYQDEYYPKFLVDKCKGILVNLCVQIEKEQPKTLEELYVLTHAATDRFNELEDEFYENGSEIETMAREVIALDFEKIAHNYGFADADIEELIAPRNW